RDPPRSPRPALCPRAVRVGARPKMSRSIVAAVLVVALAGTGCGPGPRHPALLGESGAVGSWAHALLSDETYTRLVVTVDYVAGEAPSPEALVLLQKRLYERCNKPDGVVVELG